MSHQQRPSFSGEDVAANAEDVAMDLTEMLALPPDALQGAASWA